MEKKYLNSGPLLCGSAFSCGISRIIGKVLSLLASVTILSIEFLKLF